MDFPPFFFDIAHAAPLDIDVSGKALGAGQSPSGFLSGAYESLFPIALTAVSMLAIGYLLYGALQYVMSAGSAEKAKAAQTTITNAVIGIIIASCIFIIIGAATGLGRMLQEGSVDPNSDGSRQQAGSQPTEPGTKQPIYLAINPVGTNNEDGLTLGSLYISQRQHKTTVKDGNVTVRVFELDPVTGGEIRFRDPKGIYEACSKKVQFSADTFVTLNLKRLPAPQIGGPVNEGGCSISTKPFQHSLSR